MRSTHEIPCVLLLRVRGDQLSMACRDEGLLVCSILRFLWNLALQLFELLLGGRNLCQPLRLVR